MKKCRKFFFVWFILTILVIPVINVDAITYIDKVEIDNVDTNLKVGEAPKFTATLKDHATIENIQNIIEINETYTDSTRFSLLTTDSEASQDSDGKIKDYIYEYVLDMDIKSDQTENYGFNNETKLFINGKEVTVTHSDVEAPYSWIKYLVKDLKPVGYVESPELVFEFYNEQETRLKEEIFELVKQGNVTYPSEGYKDVVELAFHNNEDVEIGIIISGFTLNNIYGLGTESDATVKQLYDSAKALLNENQHLAAFYELQFKVMIGSGSSDILETSTPLKVTFGKPHGLPELKKGYKRVYKFLRFHYGDETTVIDAVETDDGLEIESDKFSVFILYYEDVKTSDEDIVNPKTSVTNVLIPSVIIEFILGAILIHIYKTNKKLI